MIGIAGNDARLLMRSAIPTAIAGAAALVAGAFVAGGRGALGALLGVLLVAVFFTISMVIVGWVSRVKPSALMPAAVGTFLAKVLLLLVVIAALNGTTAFNTKVFGFTAIGCVLVWTGGQVASLARRMPYVEPISSTASTSSTASAASADPARETDGVDDDSGNRSRAVPGGARQEHSVNTGGDR